MPLSSCPGGHPSLDRRAKEREPHGRHPQHQSTPRIHRRNRALDRATRRSRVHPRHARGEGRQRERDPVGDSRREVRGGELRVRPRRRLGGGLGNTRRMPRKGGILVSAVERPSGTRRRYQAPPPLDSAEAVPLEMGKLIEAAGYGVEVDSLVKFLGLDLADLRFEPFGPSCEGLPVLVL